MQKLRQTKIKVMDRIAITLRNLLSRQLLLVSLGIFLFSNTLIAQVTSFQVGTRTRQMKIYPTPTGNQNRPLVIWLHGINGDYSDIDYLQMTMVGRENNFHVVSGNGIDGRWDISGNTDTDYILAIIEEMSRRYGIDRTRVYLTGFSMGGMMTYHAATKIADKIAAFAPACGYLISGPRATSSRPIPLLHTHGEKDDFVHYNNVQQHVDAWRARNGCPSTGTFIKPYPTNMPSSLSSMRTWGPCTNGVEVAFLSIAGVGHIWSDNPNGVHTSREVWKFCSRFSLSTVPPPPPPGYTMFKNRGTGLQIDGMYRSTNGSNAGQYATSGSTGQQWMVETAGSYVKLKNRATGLYLDGMGRTTNGSICGQYAGGTSYNQQWTIETLGSYVKLRNRGTGLYVDGMGRTTNGSDLGQYASGGSYNQQWTMSTVSGSTTASIPAAEMALLDAETTVKVYPNPTAGQVTITLPDSYKDDEKLVDVLDVSGNTVISEKFRGTTHTLNIGSLSKGMYLLSVRSDQKLVIKKVIKK